MDDEISNSKSHEIVAKEINQTWNKIVRDSKKIGFRNGAEIGQDQSFQDYFDKGYSLGFATGFALGEFKGALRAKEIQTGTEETDGLLNNSRRGCCCICKDNTLLQRSIEEIRLAQVTSSNIVLKSLHLRHSDSLHVSTPYQLN